MGMPIRVLNEEGRRVFREDLYQMAFGRAKFLANRDKLLHDAKYHETGHALLPMVNPTQDLGGTLGKAGEYLYSVLGARGMALPPGAWDYLSLVYWEQVAQRVEGGGWRLGQGLATTGDASSPIAHYRYDPDNRRRTYRHRLNGAYVVYARYHETPEKASLLFNAALNQHSDEFEQVFDRREMLANPVLVEVANRLYFDSETGAIRKSFRAQRHVAAAFRRYTTIMNEFAETFNFQEMKPLQVIALLPEKEFGPLIKLALSKVEQKQVDEFRADIEKVS